MENDRQPSAAVVLDLRDPVLQVLQGDRPGGEGAGTDSVRVRRGERLGVRAAGVRARGGVPQLADLPGVDVSAVLQRRQHRGLRAPRAERIGEARDRVPTRTERRGVVADLAALLGRREVGEPLVVERVPGDLVTGGRDRVELRPGHEVRVGAADVGAVDVEGPTQTARLKLRSGVHLAGGAVVERERHDGLRTGARSARGTRQQDDEQGCEDDPNRPRAAGVGETKSGHCGGSLPWGRGWPPLRIQRGPR